MKAIVIGAGIGGLSAAVALKKAGIDCTVFEAVKEIRPVGAAISIWPNGVKCMQHLGMGDIIETWPRWLSVPAGAPAPSRALSFSAKCWTSGVATRCSSASASKASMKTTRA